MRFLTVFASLLTTVVLTACAYTPVNSGYVSEQAIHQGESADSCNMDNIVWGSRDKESTGKHGLDPESISVLNWNIYKGRNDGWAAEFKQYIHDHDVVTVQEAHLGDDLRSMLDWERRYWTMNTAFYLQGKATGVMTASRVRPVYSCGQQAVEPLIRVPKTSLISYYPLDGMNETLLVANIHGINFSLGLGTYREQIEKLYHEIAKHKGPVVLAGDFNTWSDGRLAIVNNLAHRLSLDSVEYSSHNRTRIFGNALDHVFYRGLDPVEQEAWHVASSDHNPMRVVFRVN
jgi:endonuclease/exonuclease/phosphatase (EEP) superfamily protein YafD